MDINVLREYHHLAQSLSFTKTAKHFYIAQSALSRHISSLERELGVQLFVRSNNGVFLTEAGRLFAKDIEQLLAFYESSLSRLASFGKGIDSELRFGYLYGAVSSFLPKTIIEFNKLFPSVSISAIPLEINEVIEALDQNAISLGVTSGVWQFSPDYYNEQPLYLDGISMVLPYKHPLIKAMGDRGSVCIDEIRGRRDILLNSGGVNYPESAELSNMLRFHDVGMPSSADAGAADLLSGMIAMLASGCGLISYRHVENVYGCDRFKFIPVETGLPPFHVRAVWKKSQENQAILALVNELVKASENFVIGSSSVLPMS